MTTANPERLPLSWKQVAAFRLARQHLSPSHPGKDLLKVAGDMCGAQAQVHSAAQLSLWARMQALSLTEVEAAIDERRLVKAACMRRTLFLVPAEQLAIFVRGTARRAEKELRWALGKGVPERVVEAAIQAALDVLDEPLTRPEIGARVNRALGVRTQDVHGGGWGSRSKVAAVPVGDLTYQVVSLLHLAAARGVVCYGPMRENKPTFVRADAWIPGWRDVSPEEAEDLLLRRYLRAFGPATARDFAAWSGMNLTESREIWARQASDLALVDVEGWKAWALSEDLHMLANTRHEEPVVNLLPYFDTYLLGHKERGHLVSPEDYSVIYRPQGWITPVVLVDGRAAGVWEHKRLGDRLNVKVAPFEPLSSPIIDGIRARARDLALFLKAPDVEIQVA